MTAWNIFMHNISSNEASSTGWISNSESSRALWDDDFGFSNIHTNAFCMLSYKNSLKKHTTFSLETPNGDADNSDNFYQWSRVDKKCVIIDIFNLNELREEQTKQWEVC